MLPKESAILERLERRYDDIVASIYRAGSGVDNWRTPISMIAEVYESWAVQLLCVNKQNGTIQRAYEGGSADPAAGVDFLRTYHLIDPRLKDLIRLPVDGWCSCEDHYDEAFVQKDRYYTEYLIPYGGRYMYAGKIFEDSASMCVFGTITRVGRPPLAPDEKQAFTRITEHFSKALNIQQALTEKSDRQSIRLKRKDGRRVAATLLALRPEATMASFGRTPQALFTVFEPGTAIDVDPFLLSAMFDLTPAEARLAAKIVNGESPEKCAQTLGVKISTVRSQLMAIYGKTGATGQADLVRLVLSATAI